MSGTGSKTEEPLRKYEIRFRNRGNGSQKAFLREPYSRVSMVVWWTVSFIRRFTVDWDGRTARPRMRSPEEVSSGSHILRQLWDYRTLQQYFF